MPVQPKKDIPIEYLQKRFSVNELGELFWRPWPRSHFAGKRAGRINNRGYWMVSFYYEGRQRKVLVHRIVWALTHGVWPVNFIDHVNRDRADNRPSNLRDVSNAENMANNSRVNGGGPLVRDMRSSRYRAHLANTSESAINS